MVSAVVTLSRHELLQVLGAAAVLQQCCGTGTACPAAPSAELGPPPPAADPRPRGSGGSSRARRRAPGRPGRARLPGLRARRLSPAALPPPGAARGPPARSPARPPACRRGQRSTGTSRRCAAPARRPRASEASPRGELAAVRLRSRYRVRDRSASGARRVPPAALDSVARIALPASGRRKRNQRRCWRLHLWPFFLKEKRAPLLTSSYSDLSTWKAPTCCSLLLYPSGGWETSRVLDHF
uniref:uncharacterized protein LOC143313151 n=1 Tax=Arvicanthis niloticus TaxID=61156 RepID=UPI00402BE5A5